MPSSSMIARAAEKFSGLVRGVERLAAIDRSFSKWGVDPYNVR
jgi:hypothetical protein